MINSFNLPEINQEEALDLTKFFIKAEQNVFLLGKVGTGKSSIAIQAAKECNYKVNYINLSVIERPDLAGYPDIMAPGDIVNYKSPNFLPKLGEGQKPDCVILFDEVDKVSPEVTAPLLEILLFRKINGSPINAVACILTGNLINERTHSNILSSALLDRGAKYILSFDFDKWLGWAKSNNIHDLIIGFLCHDPQFACGNIDNDSYASPSPRSWALASNALIQAKEFKITDIESITQIISGYVGTEVGLRFKIWYEYYRKFEPTVINLIDFGNMNLDFNKLIPTEKLVFVIAACHYAKLRVFNNKSKDRFIYLDRLCDFLINYKVEPEIQVMGLHNSFSFDSIGKEKLYQCKSFFNLFTKLNEFLTIKKS